MNTVHGISDNGKAYKMSLVLSHKKALVPEGKNPGVQKSSMNCNHSLLAYIETVRQDWSAIPPCLPLPRS